MKLFSGLIVAILLGVLPVSAFDPASGGVVGSATQAATGVERTLVETLYDLTDSYFTFPCAADGTVLPIPDGELIRIEGQLYERSSLVLDAAGHYHYNLSTMPVGLRGISASGEEFRVSENSQTIANQRLDGGTGAYRQELKMVGKDTHRTFWLVASGNYLFTPEGELRTSRGSLRVECRV